MKVLVAYMSRTGNTKKVAEAIYDGIDDNMKRLHNAQTDDAPHRRQFEDRILSPV
ncbi:MAG: flavodoxin family protein [Dehalococcoidales bacterium]|nr:flavodoxin family protein [Dehalococcoidales bacterium]